MAKFLDYEGLSYYTGKIKSNFSYILDTNGFKNFLNLKLDDLKVLNKNKVSWQENIATSADGHVTISFNKDHTLTINSDGNNAQLEFKLTNYSLTTTLDNGTYVLSGCVDGSNTTYDLRMIIYSTPDQFILNHDGGNIFNYLGMDFAINIVIRANQTMNKVFKPMLCKENVWNISNNYQSYSMSNVQITDFIQTPANNTDIDNIWDSI